MSDKYNSPVESREKIDFIEQYVLAYIHGGGTLGDGQWLISQALKQWYHIRETVESDGRGIYD